VYTFLLAYSIEAGPGWRKRSFAMIAAHGFEPSCSRFVV